ncbi:amine dehydrogenase large subunit [Pseudomonadota bacterium]
MRLLFTSLIYFILFSSPAAAQLAEEKLSMAMFPEPQDSWFLIKSSSGSFVFDGDTGEMQGLISHNWYTPAVVPNLERKETYLVESWFSRGTRGTRQDVLSIVDMTTLTPKAEIDIPNKAAALSFRNHIGLLEDRRHLVIFNMTPAQSVSIVDVIDQEFVGEISTPGCAIIMPADERAFMMICGDGGLQYLELDGDGNETRRERTKSFFVVDEDPVFDKPMQTNDGWLLISHTGLAYEVDPNGGKMKVSKPWSLMSDEDKADEWRPGGEQPFSVHRETGLLYMLVHQGGVDTHHEPGTAIWVYDLQRKRRVGKIEFEKEGQATHILASQEQEPKLYVFDKEKKLQIYDALLLRHLRTIDEPGPGPGLLQSLAHYD